ncbi:MAG TPA: PIN domain-containing protein [Thermoanaerobaculia bacterium]|nr:PIN domain-containing protein [Thermoanaerobaculia bacterium]
MSEALLLDSGPLVAFLNRKDRLHSWALQVFGSVAPPLFTCEAVLSEACFLLRRASGGPDAVLDLVERELLVVGFRCEPEIPALRRLLARYANRPMSFADACLVRMSEQLPSCRVLTADEDFKVYRRHSRQVIPTLLPAG